MLWHDLKQCMPDLFDMHLVIVFIHHYLINGKSLIFIDGDYLTQRGESVLCHSWYDFFFPGLEMLHAPFIVQLNH